MIYSQFASNMFPNLSASELACAKSISDAMSAMESTESAEYLACAELLQSFEALSVARDVVEPVESEQDMDESMDGDFDSGMASAGYGTDEDYGGCDDRY